MRALYYAGRGAVYLTTYLVGVNLVVSYTGSWIAGGAVVILLMYSLRELLDRVYRGRQPKFGWWLLLGTTVSVVPVWMATEALSIVPSIDFEAASLLSLVGGMLVGGVIILVVGVSVVVIRYFRTPLEERESLTS